MNLTVAERAEEIRLDLRVAGDHPEVPTLPHAPPSTPLDYPWRWPDLLIRERVQLRLFEETYPAHALTCSHHHENAREA